MSQWNRSGENQFSFSQSYAAPEQAPTKKRRNLLPVVALTLGAALVGGIVGSSGLTLSVANLSQPAPVVVNNTAAVNWVTGASAAASPSVVTLAVNTNSNGGAGSGVVLTEDGYILTNAHVATLGGLTETASIAVMLWDGQVLAADLVGFDSVYDLAVLKIEAAGLKPVVFADSKTLNVGQNVVAIGAPLGLSSTVTQGIISALNRTIQVASSEVSDDPGLQFYTGNGGIPISLQVIQTDAAINPGNSGGALVNSSGELIGINVAIATAGSGTSGSIGVGFAIPSNTSQRIANEIIETGVATHGLLGALVSDSREATGGFSNGAYVEGLSDDGAAKAAGIRQGDIITLFAGQLVEGASDLTALVRAEPAGAEVEVHVLRNGQKLVFQVVLGSAADLQ
jgi:putative serine protease PepD